MNLEFKKKLYEKDFKNINISEENKERIISFLCLCRKGEIIYPSSIAYYCKTEKSKIIDILDKIESLEKSTNPKNIFYKVK